MAARTQGHREGGREGGSLVLPQHEAGLWNDVAEKQGQSHRRGSWVGPFVLQPYSKPGVVGHWKPMK